MGSAGALRPGETTQGTEDESDSGRGRRRGHLTGATHATTPTIVDGREANKGTTEGIATVLDRRGARTTVWLAAVARTDTMLPTGADSHVRRPRASPGRGRDPGRFLGRRQGKNHAEIDRSATGAAHGEDDGRVGHGGSAAEKGGPDEARLRGRRRGRERPTTGG